VLGKRTHKGLIRLFGLGQQVEVLVQLLTLEFLQLFLVVELAIDDESSGACRTTRIILLGLGDGLLGVEALLDPDVLYLLKPVLTVDEFQQKTVVVLLLLPENVISKFIF
jgi:hypothetical protein